MKLIVAFQTVTLKNLDVRRRIPKEVPPGVGQADYMGIDDYVDEDEVDLLLTRVF